MTTSANARLAWKLAAVVVVMVALSFAAVPFYGWFCRTTGYGGTPSVAEAAPDTILDRQVTVRFDANVAPTMPWHFRPMQREMTIRLGETGLVDVRREDLRSLAREADGGGLADARGGPGHDDNTI